MRIVAPLRPPALRFMAASPSGAFKAFDFPATGAAGARLRSAYRTSGGVVGSETMTRLLEGRWDQPVSVLARWIVEREVVHFKLDAQIMLPLFQFDLKVLAVVPDVSAVLHQLRSAFDDDAIADWFAMPNAWLAGASPAEAIHREAPAVLQAARVDRFALEG